LAAIAIAAISAQRYVIEKLPAERENTMKPRDTDKYNETTIYRE